MRRVQLILAAVAAVVLLAVIAVTWTIWHEAAKGPEKRIEPPWAEREAGARAAPAEATG